MRKLLLLMLMMVSVQMNAQDNQQKIIKLPQWVNDIKLSGYGMLQYQANDKKGNHENSFNLRIARLGKCRCKSMATLPPSALRPDLSIFLENGRNYHSLR